ncbi:MAG TPA: hypothetical protein VFE62_24875 [Gemmataceae bacterium]|nr:hypothetical protein [Gemmataceae bacterium]
MSRFLKALVACILGVTLCASIAYAGWTLWTNFRIVPTENTLADTPVQPKALPIASVSAQVASPDIAAPVAPVADATATADPVKPAEAGKELLKGKQHEPQSALLVKMVQLMHADAYNRFINQPGMGMSRMLPTLSVMPREWKMPQWTSEELAKEQPPIAGAKDLSLIHRLSLKNFGSDYKTDDERWQAMVNEANSKEMKKQNLWEIKSLDLVGLVVHESPLVYVSEKLPDMKDLKNRPTRELDVFESEGIEELMNGKQIYMRQKEGTIRVLGPIHAAKACLKCHSDAKEGAMLGAFSYTLRPGRYVPNSFGKGVEINSATPIGNPFANPFGGTPPTLRPAPKK